MNVLNSAVTFLYQGCVVCNDSRVQTGLKIPLTGQPCDLGRVRQCEEAGTSLVSTLRTFPFNSWFLNKSQSGGDFYLFIYFFGDYNL